MVSSLPFNSLFFRQSKRYLVFGILVCSLYAAAHQYALATGVIWAVLVGACGTLWVLQRSKQALALTTEAALAAKLQLPQDPLTGIANREIFETRLEEEGRRERRPGEPTGLLLVDVDAFDELRGDTCAIDGDVALLTMARSLTRMLPRRTDLLARFDKSTFVVMLPGTDLPGSLRVAARLRWAILRLSIAHPGPPAGLVTASSGVAVQHGALSGGGRVLLAAAESAQSKAGGKAPDALEYVLLEEEGDLGEKPAVPTTAHSSIRAWIPERDGLKSAF